MAEGIELLNQELQKQVLENHDDLLKQASHATKLENVLETMNLHVQNLFANAERLKAQVDYHAFIKATELHFCLRYRFTVHTMLYRLILEFWVVCIWQVTY